VVDHETEEVGEMFIRQALLMSLFFTRYVQKLRVDQRFQISHPGHEFTPE
jgi:hypothetical protein